MSGKILLTGISGWIAKHTAIELLNSGYEVLGTERNKNLLIPFRRPTCLSTHFIYFDNLIRFTESI